MSKNSNTSNTSSSTKKCIVCGQRATSFCNKCKEAWYCSAGCQKYDWKLHKQLCAESPYPPKDPQKSSVRAIYFPEDGSGPSFVEVALTRMHDEEDGVDWDKAHKEPIFPEDWWVQEVHIGRNPVGDQDLGYTLKVGVKEDGLLDKRLSSNLCIRKLNTTKCPILHPWPGPLRAMKIATTPRFSTTETYLDIEIGDLRHLIDYFILYVRQGAEWDRAIALLRQDIPSLSKSGAGKAGGTQGAAAGVGEGTKEGRGKRKGKQEPKPTPAASDNSLSDLPLGSSRPNQSTSSSATKTAIKNLPPGKSVHGVKIYCRGDQTTLKVAKFVPVSLTPDEVQQMSLFSCPIPPISALIKLPIRIYRYPIPESNWHNQEWSCENQSTTFLHLDPKSGWAPFNWQNEVGTVLLVRDDRKEFYVEHVEALCEFCQHHLGPLFEEWMENGSQDGGSGSRKVDHEMTKGGFEAWFERYRIQQAMGVLGMHEFKRNSLRSKFRWERWISPYDVQK